MNFFFKGLYEILKKHGLSIPLNFFSFNVLYKIVKPTLTEVLKKEVKKGSIFVDIGANIGYYTIVASKLVGENGKVFAFEPDLVHYKRLIKNLKFNNCKNVIPLNMAISDKKTELGFFLAPENTSDHATYEIRGRKRISIKAIDLDSFLRENSIEKVDFIKIDIQCYEPVAINGMKKTLKNNKDINFITEFWPYGIERASHNPSEYLEFISKLGFSFFIVKERKKIANEISLEKAIKLRPQFDLLCKKG